MSSFDMRNYWPSPIGDQQQITQLSRIDATGAILPSSLQRYRTVVDSKGRSLLWLDEFAGGKYLDTWYLFRDPTRGVLEIGDNTPPSKPMFVTGKEILWGGAQNKGDVLSSQIEIDVGQSSGYKSTDPWIWGWNVTTFEDFLASFTTIGGTTYSNVVQVLNVQSYCQDAACSKQNVSHSRYWFAPGLGFVQAQYIDSGVTAFASVIASTELLVGAP